MLLPQELRNYSFSHAIRGYTAAEVEEYIEFLIGKYEEVYRENGELEHKLSIAMQSLDTLRAREEKIAALDTEMKKAAARILADSEKKQQEILADAETRRRQIIEDAGEYADRIVAEADAHVTVQENRFAALKKEIETLRDTLFAAYSGHIDQVEELVNTVLAENFTDPIKPAANLAEIAEEVAVPVPEETTGSPAEETAQTEEIEEIEEIVENPEDVYTEEELREEEPQPAEEASAGNAAIFLPDDFHYDEDVYSEEELRDADAFAEPETYEEPGTFEDPASFTDREAFEEPASFTEPAVFDDIEYFEEIAAEKDTEAFGEIAEEDDARLLQELHEAFDKTFSAMKADTATEDPGEAVVYDKHDVDDAGGDEWLAALKMLEHVISDPGKNAPQTDPDAFTFIEEPEDTVDTGRRGLFGKKKPKDR